MADEENLIRKRGSIKAKLTAYSKLVCTLEEKLKTSDNLSELDFTILESRTTRLEKLLDEFDEIQIQIELKATDLIKEYAERDTFETSFYTETGKAKIMMKEHYKKQENSVADTHSPPASVVSSGVTGNNQTNCIKLPTIQLPKFDGTHENWLEFRDTFESLIHTNSTISAVQKYHYLRASLEKDAAQVIKSLSLSADNYIVAWDTICERFNNTRVLVHNHVKALYNLEPMHKESSVKIRNLIDTVSKNLRSLEQLGQPTSNWDTLLVYGISTKLDPATAREWEKYKSEEEIPTLENLKSFLKSKADLLETLEINYSEKRIPKANTNTRGFFSSNISCINCKGEHAIYNCGEFTKFDVNKRISRAKELKLCFNCLRVGHATKICRMGTCKKCNSKHHTLLHINQEKPAKEETTIPSVSLASCNHQHQVLLSTAQIQIRDNLNAVHTVRALLDSGSQSSFISANLCERLNLNKTKVKLSVIGLNHVTSKIEYKCEVNIQAQHNAYETSLNCFVIPEITGNVPNIHVSQCHFDIPQNIQLADPTFNKPDRIDILIGADLFWSLICIGQINLGKNKPTLQKTKFGWIVSGPTGATNSQVSLCNFSKNIEAQLTRFWEIEECNQTKILSKEEIACEQHYIENTKRDCNGRFIVSIPMKESPDKLGESREQAKKRFFSLERKLQGNDKLKEMYTQFMAEYESLGHMTKTEENDNYKTPVYYMPHHGVLREESITTKLRVVFDASACTSSGYSLNNLQMTGPTIQQELLSILLRFRQHRYVIAADIAKMYRQVLISEDQRSLQRILWRANPSEPLSTYTLNTVTYGTTAASFLAIRSLHQTAQDCKVSSPEIARIIETDFYVDDLITGSNSIQEAARVCHEIKTVLKGGGFELRKFYSNNPQVLQHVAKNDSSVNFIEFGENENAKTLGLTWCPNSDELMYRIKQTPNNQKVTKRTVLSTIAQVFDPLGLLGPCTIIAKILLQQLWLQKLSWDESLPSSLHTTWSQFREELITLNDLRIRRHAICEDAMHVEMHGFSDASENAYGACVYLRTTNSNGKIFTYLLCAKTKVAPLKTITIPRLELCGAVILARLTQKAKTSLNLKIDKFTYWSDSTIVLCWLKTPPNALKSFVSNRVAEVQELTASGEWRHVPTKDNPADLLSRGTSPSKIQNCKLWWHGPKWLSQNEAQWPNIKQHATNLPELRTKIQTFVVQELKVFPFEKFSNLLRLKRTVAYMFRFKDNCKLEPEFRQQGPITVTELNQAFKCLIKLAQKEYFSQEIVCLNEKTTLSNKSAILNLNPFLDDQGIMRVGGRLKNSDFAYDKRHPIIVSSKHHLTKLIFEWEHIALHHAGPQLLLTSVRENFWPTAGRNIAKRVVHKCVKCFRQNPRFVQPIMGQLPKERLQPGPPFNTTGVDYAGPFMIKDRKGRGCKISKCYIALFICFSVKAIHLELVADLTKESFILALRRFVGRRGKPAKIWSDNGTNFVGAKSELDELGNFLIKNENALVESLSCENIDWKFIPPHSPHFGGLWEAGVKQVKFHIKRVMGNTRFTFEEFYSLLVQIEAVVNSRPLSPLSSNPDDLLPLTPAHFLVGRPLTNIPDVDLTTIPENRLSVFQHIQVLKQHFWERWSKEYIFELQRRSKWKGSIGELKDGMLVLLKEDNQPPMKWRLGRIETLHPGKDNVSRVASIRTQNGVVKRGFTKICPLPLDVSC